MTLSFIQVIDPVDSISCLFVTHTCTVCMFRSLGMPLAPMQRVSAPGLCVLPLLPCLFLPGSWGRAAGAFCPREPALLSQSRSRTSTQPPYCCEGEEGGGSREGRGGWGGCGERDRRGRGRGNGWVTEPKLFYWILRRGDWKSEALHADRGRRAVQNHYTLKLVFIHSRCTTEGDRLLSRGKNRSLWLHSFRSRNVEMNHKAPTNRHFT